MVNTKFYIPLVRGNLVPRPHLVKRLDEGLKGPLTLISAPAGYGKTTLLAEWHCSFGNEIPTAWLSLDAEDNDLLRFLFYLVFAIEGVRTGLTSNTIPLLQSSPPAPFEAVLATFVNDLSSATCLGGDPYSDMILVLDDYYLIHTPAIHDAVAYLLAHLPLTMHLVILTREDPPLPIAKLRARGEIHEMREADLRFSPSEVEAFLRRGMGLQLTEPAITTLMERTEGWVAGLQMAVLAMTALRASQAQQPSQSEQFSSTCEDFIAAFRGDDRYIMDFLMEEVVQRQPQEIREFLLHTSILSRLCAPLCEAVIGDKEVGDKGIGEQASASIPFASLLAPPTPLSPAFPCSSQDILEYLERSNLFLFPLDNRREWYRYHHLFADLLQYRLQRRYPERLPELHRRAYHWFKLSGDVEEAMRHALAIPDHNLAADLAEGYLQQLIRASRISACLSWIRHLPGEVVRSRAYLCASCAWVHMLNGDFEAAGRYLEDSEAALEGYEPVYSPTEGRWITLAEVHGHLSAIRAYGARLRGDFPRAIALSQQALQELPATALEIRCVVALNLGIIYLAIWEPEMAWKTQLEAYEMAKGSRENLFVAVTALCQLAGIAVWQGKLREAERLCHQAIQVGTVQAGRPVSLPAVAYAHGWLVAVHNQRNEADAARRHLEKALELVELVGPLATLIYARLFQARLALDAGDFSEAETWLKWAEEKSRDYPISGPVKTEWVVNRGRFYLEQGDAPAAASWLTSQGVEASDLLEAPNLGDDSLRSMRTRLPEYLLLARALLAQGELSQSEELLDRICTAAEGWQYGESLLEALVLRAVAATVGQGPRVNTDRGLPYLERALNLAAPEGYVRPFLIAGEPMVKLLRQAIIQGIQPAYVNRLLAELAEKERRKAGKPGAYYRVVRGTPGAFELVEPLTERERQVLRLLAAGLTSTEVAEELVISVSTARSYIKSIYGKLDAHNRAEAFEKGIQLGQI